MVRGVGSGPRARKFLRFAVPVLVLGMMIFTLRVDRDRYFPSNIHSFVGFAATAHSSESHPQSRPGGELESQPPESVPSDIKSESPAQQAVPPTSDKKDEDGNRDENPEQPDHDENGQDRLDPLPTPPTTWDEYAFVRRGSKFLVFMGFRFQKPFPLMNISIENKRLYAEVHGYDFKLDSPDEISEERPPVWHKIIQSRRYLDQYEWVCWIDIDTIIMDMQRKLEDVVACNYSCEFVGAKTFEFFAIGEETKEQEHRLNGGAWCVHNSSWTRMFLDKVYNQTSLVNHFNYEQRALQVTIRDNPEFLSRIKYVNEHKLQTHNWQYQDGDFIVHYYGGMQGCWGYKNGCKDEFKERLIQRKNMAIEKGWVKLPPTDPALAHIKIEEYKAERQRRLRLLERMERRQGCSIGVISI